MADTTNAPARKIVCIDDDTALRNLMILILNREGFEVLQAEDGQMGLELISKEKPNLVLLDIMMPVMDGFEVLTKLKSDPVLMETPVVMVTARTDIETIIHCLLIGAADYITLPFSPREMAGVVKRILDNGFPGIIRPLTCPPWLLDAYWELRRYRVLGSTAELFCRAKQVAQSPLIVQSHEVVVREIFKEVGVLLEKSEQQIELIFSYMAYWFVEMNPDSQWTNRARQSFSKNWEVLGALKDASPSALMTTVLTSLQEYAQRIQIPFLAIEADPVVSALPIIISEEDARAGRGPFGSKEWVVRDYAKKALGSLSEFRTRIDDLLSHIEEYKEKDQP